MLWKRGRQHCRLTLCRLVEFVRIRSKYKQQSDDAGLSNDDHKHDKVDAHNRGCNGYGGDDDGVVGDDDDEDDDDDDEGVTFPNGCCRGSWRRCPEDDRPTRVTLLVEIMVGMVVIDNTFYDVDDDIHLG